LQDPTKKKAYEDADQKLKDAEAGLKSAETEAREAYAEDDDPNKPPFEQWVLTNWPPYNAAKKIRDSAKTVYDQAYNAYMGPINALADYKAKLAKALDTKTLNQSYVTSTFSSHSHLLLSIIRLNMAVRNENGSTFKPSYSAFGLRDQLNTWIQGSDQKETFVDVKIDSATPTTSTSDGNGIYLKLTTKGVQKFDVRPGLW
jgi:hypothetical protein